MNPQFSIRSLASALALGSCLLLACGGANSDVESTSNPSDAVHPLIGKRGPDFAQKAVSNGKDTISLHALAGKVAIVDFWATWCEPCKKSFPRLEALNTKYESDGVAIVGVSEDDDQTGIRAFASNLGATFPLVWDEDKSIASKWQPKSMPTTFILDRSGMIRFVHLGYHDNEEAEIEREIKSLL